MSDNKEEKTTFVRYSSEEKMEILNKFLFQLNFTREEINEWVKISIDKYISNFFNEKYLYDIVKESIKLNAKIIQNDIKKEIADKLTKHITIVIDEGESE